ncbi:LysR family transcriptional regulator [Azospirillum picis]|uniref:LysR family transcriptional regulator for bpeEF and oprC n=1 Tax=Azospirillum picis TaxID=488438 RepID=A0ABU0MR91_9PROT|nr:LysR family transcriptional regulator [Azospirillum picis]MBP2302424.1 LysR family transcriptional regulator for bpeEF and oprC [Azospirillum picis]MDQ0536003.1 LysR family transcriptional regulator for bpeEF and oprC [Azospirillum picis]
MDKLHAMRVFVRVVEVNSFSKAADTLGLPRASVTTTIQNLEASLGVRLLQRTTRKLNLTLDGAAYLEGATRILQEIEEVESSFTSARKTPRGRLRVDMPGSIGRLVIIPAIHEFHNAYPDIELMLGLSDRPIDLIQEGVDCVLRVGELQDSSLIARRVGAFRPVTCASPDYLAAHGMPRSLEELERHVAVKYFTRTGKVHELSFERDGEEVEVKMAGTVSVNDADAYVTCGVEGLGIVQAARFMALPHLRSGALVEILPEWRPALMPISALYPQNRHLSPKVRVFVDWIAELFERCPLMQGEDVPLDACRGEAKRSGRMEKAVPVAVDSVAMDADGACLCVV